MTKLYKLISYPNFFKGEGAAEEASKVDLFSVLVFFLLHKILNQIHYIVIYDLVFYFSNKTRKRKVLMIYCIHQVFFIVLSKGKSRIFFSYDA